MRRMRSSSAGGHRQGRRRWGRRGGGEDARDEGGGMGRRRRGGETLLGLVDVSLERAERRVEGAGAAGGPLGSVGKKRFEACLDRVETGRGHRPRCRPAALGHRRYAGIEIADRVGDAIGVGLAGRAGAAGAGAQALDRGARRLVDIVELARQLVDDGGDAPQRRAPARRCGRRRPPRRRDASRSRRAGLEGRRARRANSRPWRGCGG